MITEKADKTVRNMCFKRGLSKDTLWKLDNPKVIDTCMKAIITYRSSGASISEISNELHIKKDEIDKFLKKWERHKEVPMKTQPFESVGTQGYY